MLVSHGESWEVPPVKSVDEVDLAEVFIQQRLSEEGQLTILLVRLHLRQWIVTYLPPQSHPVWREFLVAIPMYKRHMFIDHFLPECRSLLSQVGLFQLLRPLRAW